METKKLIDYANKFLNSLFNESEDFISYCVFFQDENFDDADYTTHIVLCKETKKFYEVGMKREFTSPEDIEKYGCKGSIIFDYFTEATYFTIKDVQERFADQPEELNKFMEAYYSDYKYDFTGNTDEIAETIRCESDENTFIQEVVVFLIDDYYHVIYNFGEGFHQIAFEKDKEEAIALAQEEAERVDEEF